MKLRNPTLVRLAGRLAAWIIRAWLLTIRTTLDVETARRHPADPRAERFLYGFWHESILALVGFRVRASVLISKHADGELIATAAEALGFGTVRGSTSRGGYSALNGMIQRAGDAEPTHLAITPDGPRGPRRTVQIGVVAVASQTGLPVVPVGIGFTRCWRAKSWDRFAVPKPFSRVFAVAGEPIAVPPGLDRSALEGYRLRVEKAALRATEAAEQLADAWAGRDRPVAAASAVPGPHARPVAPVGHEADA